MRSFVNILVILSAMSAMAFDSAKWEEKRQRLTREAEKLQAAYSNCVSRIVEPAEDVLIPIETFPDGSVKTSVHAAKAVYFLESGLVWGEDVKVSKLDRAGEIDTEITAKNCVIDREKKSCWAEGKAAIRHRGTSFTGENVYFSSPEGYVMVLKNSEIISDDLKFGGLRP